MQIRHMVRALALTAITAASAGAQQILDPDATYVSQTTQLAFPLVANFTDFGSVSFFGFTIDFRDAANNALNLNRRSVNEAGGGWATWSTAPNSENDGVNPFRVGFTNGAEFLRFNFSAPVGLFGFEAQGDPFDDRTFTVNYFRGASLVGTISRTINGNGGARLLAFQDAMGITHAEVSTNADFAVAQLRVGAPSSVVPEPSTYALLASGLGFLGAVAIRRRRTVG